MEIVEKQKLTKIASRYIEIVNQIKELEEEKERLREKIINSEREKIETKDGTIRVFTRKNVILDDEKIISMISKEEILSVATINVSKFRKFAENRLNIDDFIVDFKEIKEVKIL